MLGWLQQGLRAAWAPKEGPTYSVRITENGFTFHEVGKPATPVSVTRAGVEEVRVFKRDLFAYDMICLGVVYGGGNYVEVWERDYGYDDWLKAVESHLPGTATDWWDKVAFPAFIPNETLLYRRDAEARKA